MLTQKVCAFKMLVALDKLPSKEDVPIFSPKSSCMGMPTSLHFVIKLFTFTNLVDRKWYTIVVLL